MNTIELDIKKDGGEYCLKLIIDSNEFLNNIDVDLNAIVLDELNESLKGDGAYLIFTCSCGVADCGGWDKVQVKYEEDSVKWKFAYNERKYEFEFEHMFYKGEIERILFEVEKRKIKLSPQYITHPE